VRRVAIVGASVAGVSAARALRELGMDGDIVMVGAEPHRPYDRPPLSKELLLGTSEPAQIALLDEADDGLGLTWRLGCRARRLLPAERALELDDGERLVVDGLVVATGSMPRMLPSLLAPSGTLPAGVQVLRTLEDALALRDALRRGLPVAVVGEKKKK
jgi:3-phenylpropionate/trans-cinnamate dioxygenase ferredoxin reductase subunit